MEHYSACPKRLANELKLLTTDPNVQSYFHYESLEFNEEFKKFHLYGYLLPRLEPYKYGSFKVCITLLRTFPFQKPSLKFLTNIYHPAVPDDMSKQEFHGASCRVEWRPTTPITQWIEENVNIIDQPEATETYCLKNLKAKELYDQSKVEYEKKVIDMIEKYSYPRPNQSIISLKFATKQIIRRQLDFQSGKIDQLPLSNNLKQYLNPSFDKK